MNIVGKSPGKKIVQVSLVTALFFQVACTSRDLRRGVTYPNAPLKRTVTFGTRTVTPMAGELPAEFATPLVSRDLIYLPSETKGLMALDKELHSLRWNFAIKNGVSSQPVIDDNMIFFGGHDGKFYALDADTGAQIWQYETKAPVYSRAAVNKGAVYFMASDDTLYALEQKTGKWLWHFKRTVNMPTTVRGNSTPFIDRDKVYVGFSDGYFAAFNTKDGNLSWETRIHKGAKFTDVDAEPVSDGTKFYVPSYDGGIYALDRNNGKVLWFADVGGAKRVLLDDNSKALYLPSSDGRVVSLDRETGRVNWVFELDAGTPTALAANGIYLMFGSSKQYFYVIHKGDGSIAYRFNVGLRSGFYGAPVHVSKDLNSRDMTYIYSQFGNLYGFQWKAVKVEKVTQ
jgi:outer membrane protein assembly factor BamB